MIAHGDYLYVFGGHVPVGDWYDTINRFHIDTKQWETLSLRLPSPLEVPLPYLYPLTYFFKTFLFQGSVQYRKV